MLLLVVVFSAAAAAPAARAQEDAGSSLQSLVGQLQDSAARSHATVRELLALVEKNPSLIEQIPPNIAADPSLERLLAEESLARAESVLSSRSSSEALALKKFVSELAGSTPEKRPELAAVLRLFGVAEKAEYLLGSGDIEALLKMRETVKSPSEENVLEAHITRTFVSRAQAELDARHPQSALLQLGRITPKFRGEKTLDLAREAVVSAERMAQGDVSAAAAAKEWVFDDPSVMALLRPLQLSDTGIRSGLAELYSLRVLYLLERNQIKAADDYYYRVIELRNDPDEANNALRLTIALRAKTDEAKSFARGRISELQSNHALTLWVRSRLFFRGYYGRFPPLFLLLALISSVLLGVIGYFKPELLTMEIRLPRWDRQWIRREPRSEPPRNMREALRDSLQPRPPDPRQARPPDSEHEKILGPGYLRDPEEIKPDEYTRLLMKFGLADGAAENDIKRAYHDAVKRYHPDSQTEASSDGINRFRELKAAYERIMEIRRGWFGRSMR